MARRRFSWLWIPVGVLFVIWLFVGFIHIETPDGTLLAVVSKPGPSIWSVYRMEISSDVMKRIENLEETNDIWERAGTGLGIFLADKMLPWHKSLFYVSTNALFRIPLSQKEHIFEGRVSSDSYYLFWLALPFEDEYEIRGEFRNKGDKELRGVKVYAVLLDRTGSALARGNSVESLRLPGGESKEFGFRITGDFFWKDVADCKVEARWKD